ncbi:MAG TPA: RsmB/NOP family class I SAM-dependent RNA methyltransferase [Chitinophagales bacterium]
MKIFKPNCEAVANVLQQVLNEEKHLGKTLDSVVSNNKKLGARDRHFIAENVFGIIRFLRYYKSVSEVLIDPVEILEDSEGKYNVNKLLAARLLQQNIELPEWFSITENEKTEIVESLKKRQKSAVLQAYTDWFFEQGEKAYGEKWEAIATALNEGAKVCIRANGLKTSREKLLEELRSENLEILLSDDTKNGLVFEQHKKLTNHQTYQNGWFEFQDISSQQVVEFCEAEPGDIVIDTCAGAGGKSLHFAAEMQNRWQIFSLDIQGHKLRELEKRALKAGAKIIETFSVGVVLNTDKISLTEAADIVLIDAPCSGSGVIKRNPENKWNLEENRVAEITNTQREILKNYSVFVKRGGYLIYATCSILPQENQEQVQQFLAENNDFVFVKEQLLIPSVNTDFDGFYMAKMKRV